MLGKFINYSALIVACVILNVEASMVLGQVPGEPGPGPSNWCQADMPSKSKFEFNHPNFANHPDFPSQVILAASKWTAVTGCDFEVTEGEDEDTPLVKGDGINTIDFFKLNDTTADAESYCPGTGSVGIVECDTVFNADFTSWAMSVNNPADRSMLTIALHEFGHWIELNDFTDQSDDVMNCVNTQPGKHLFNLSARDMDFCRQIYPDGREPWRSPPCVAAACCSNDGQSNCDITDPGTCTDPTTPPIGTILPGVIECTPNPCPQNQGACCFADGTCKVVSRFRCPNYLINYKGNATSCSEATCPPLPPPPVGACCFAEGCDDTTYNLITCMASGGERYMGDGSLCVSCNSGGGPGDGGGFGSGPGSPGDSCYDLYCDDGDTGELSSGDGEPCSVEEGQRGLNVSGSTDPENTEYGPMVGCIDCTDSLAVAMLRALRETMFLTPRGLHLVGVYYHHNEEVKAILQANPSLRTLLGDTINDFMPAVRTFLYNDINGQDFVLDSDRIVQLQALVDGLKTHAAPGLSQDLDSFMLDVNMQENKKMSEAVLGTLQVGALQEP